MASRRIVRTTTTSDALADEEIRRVEVPSILNFWAACVTEGDEVGLFLNRTEILPADNVNVESSSGVVDTSRDQLLFNTRIGRGQLRVPVPAVTTELTFLISVEPIL